MNTLIRELLKQASKLANTDDNKDIDRNFDMIVAEKFAELIVRECAHQAEIWDSEPLSGNSIAYEIRKYFGVEHE